MPTLRLNARLKEGYSQRNFTDPLPPADIWIQAASGGEAYLAQAILRHFHPPAPVRVLLTTNTRQGMDVIEHTIGHEALSPHIHCVAGYFPFDCPDGMMRTLEAVDPGVMVFLELELWPGLLSALKRQGCPTFILNGRLTPKSLDKYMIWPALWRFLAPDQILAISPSDAARFQTLFPKTRIGVMPNIKFDALMPEQAASPTRSELAGLIPDHAPSVVLGSTRQEEEQDILNILKSLFADTPEAIIGLIPRHLHRIPFWRKTLADSHIPWVLRSETSIPAPPGTVVLWDVFGELAMAYTHFTAAFVGGSLAPLGGQNFLEPLKYGIRPVIGPSWTNFSWVGPDIVTDNLVRVGQDWKAVAHMLSQDLACPGDRDKIKTEFFHYITRRQGGIGMACDLILNALEDIDCRRRP